VLDTFGALEITSEFAGAYTHAFFWQADLAGRRIEGADLLRYEAQGRIAEIRVLIRPLVTPTATNRADDADRFGEVRIAWCRARMRRSAGEFAFNEIERPSRRLTHRQ